MADAWDDDEFEVAPIAVSNTEDVAWDDEEDFEPPPVISHGDAPKLSKEKEAKLAKEKAYARQAALDAALEENETEGERRLRERARDEDADAELASDLFASGIGGGGSTKEVIVQSIEGYALKNLKDHLTLAHDIADAFETKKSKANFQTKCVKELLKKIEKSLTVEDCDEIMGYCSNVRTALEKAKKQPTAKKTANKPKQKTKKEIAAEKAEHAEMFGGFVEDEYEHYEAEYDDFM